MKFFNCFQHFQQSSKTDNSHRVPATVTEESNVGRNSDDLKMQAEDKADLSVASSSDQAPPPYLHSNCAGPSKGPGSPVLIANGWEVFHGGIEWSRSRSDRSSTVYASMLLAVRPAKSSQNKGMTSLFKILIKEDTDIEDPNLPFSSSRDGLVRLYDYSTVGKWADEMTAISHSGNSISLKVEPVYHADDRGVYTISISLCKTYEYKIPGCTKFRFHLEEFTVRPDPAQPSRSCAKNPWSDPVISDILDNDRTPAMAAKALPWLKQ